MIVFGIVLIILGVVLPSLIPTVAVAHLILVIGVIVLVVGVILDILRATGRAVGGRPTIAGPHAAAVGVRRGRSSAGSLRPPGLDECHRLKRYRLTL